MDKKDVASVRLSKELWDIVEGQSRFYGVSRTKVLSDAIRIADAIGPRIDPSERLEGVACFRDESSRKRKE